MSRYTLQTVTSELPVLVDLEAGDWAKDADGRANFLAGEHSEAFVRMVRPKDVKERLRKIFAPKEISLFLGAIQLRQALEAGDEWALQTASEKVRPWVADFAEIPARVLEIDTKRGIATLKITGVDRRYSEFLNYSTLITDMLAKARLVIWFSEKDGRFLPALYCPDWKTAAFVVTFMGRIRVCPKCSSVFIPSDEKVEYCKPEHGAAYRTARSRWRAKQRAQEGKQHKKTKRVGRFVR